MDLKEAMILVEVNTPYSSNKGIYLNRDWAVLKCAELNSKSCANQHYHLDTVPIHGEIPDCDLEVDRKGDEILFTNSNGETLYLYIKTSKDVHEERFHEEVYPSSSIVTVVDDILIQGTSIYDERINLSPDTIRKIEHEADNYTEEVDNE